MFNANEKCNKKTTSIAPTAATTITQQEKQPELHKTFHSNCGGNNIGRVHIYFQLENQRARERDRETDTTLVRFDRVCLCLVEFVRRLF